MTIMAEDGVPLPRRCELAVKRMWFLMDIPDNARRIVYIHSEKLVESWISISQCVSLRSSTCDLMTLSRQIDTMS
jgi:hypothetical protein